MKRLQKTIFIILFLSFGFGNPSIKVINHVTNTKDHLKVLDKIPVSHCSVKDLARILSTTVYENAERERERQELLEINEATGEHFESLPEARRFIMNDHQERDFAQMPEVPETDRAMFGDLVDRANKFLAGKHKEFEAAPANERASVLAKMPSLTKLA